MKNLKSGTLLISEPFMGDPNFSRSVILICEHNEKGSFGLVLNQEIEHKLADLLEVVIYSDVKVTLGGPVEFNTLHFIHTRPDLLTNSVEIKKGLFWGGNFSNIVEYLNNGVLKDDEIRFFIGYSGWAAGQLEKEINRNSWILSDSNVHDVMAQRSKEFWRLSLKNMGGDYKVISNYPTDPRLN